MKSTVLDGHWYLMGGVGQKEEVYYASLDSLVASCQPSEKPLPSVWKRLPDVHHECSSIAVFGNRLIALGGLRGRSPSSSILHPVLGTCGGHVCWTCLYLYSSPPHRRVDGDRG